MIIIKVGFMLGKIVISTKNNFVLKVTGNKACDEKNNWMENNKEMATLEEIKAATDELETILQPIFSKLKEQQS